MKTKNQDQNHQITLGTKIGAWCIIVFAIALALYVTIPLIHTIWTFWN